MSANESKTPRTDAEGIKGGVQFVMCHRAGFPNYEALARQLETENAELREALGKLLPAIEAGDVDASLFHDCAALIARAGVKP